jgi:DNA (cytosine-5)-methyltransferase 1
MRRVNETLRPSGTGPTVLDLFAGCGGLALGFEARGFKTIGFEMDADFCASYNANLAGTCHRVFLTPETDLPPADIIIAGPPCQPFSVGGNQLGLVDSRDGFPTFISAVRRLRPEVWLFENVRGLFYRSRSYLHEILAELESLGYELEVKLHNAVAFDVPQNRERLFVVGHRGGFGFPTESRVRVSAGEALGEMASQVPPNSRFLTPSMDAYVARYEKASKCIRPRDLHLDRPARTLTCRNLAGATADMQRIRLADGRRRRLTLREAARLQSFPDWFEFTGSEGKRFEQVGNAVPPMLGYHLAGSIKAYLEGVRVMDDEPKQLSLV